MGDNLTWRQSPYFRIPYVDIEGYEYEVADDNLFSLLPDDTWRTHLCMPVNRHNGVITICAVEPSADLKAQLESLLGLRVLFIQSSESGLKIALSRRSLV